MKVKEAIKITEGFTRTSQRCLACLTACQPGNAKQVEAAEG